MAIDDEILLNDFKKVIRKRDNGNIIDLDASFEKDFLFQAFRFEDVLKGTNRSIPPNRWSYHRIGLIRKGEGEFITGIYQYKAVKNSLVVIPARVISSSRNWSLDMEGYVTVFKNDFFLQNNYLLQHIESKNILSGCIQPNVELTDNQADEIAEIFETILTEKQEKGVGANELICLKIIELLIKSERFFDDQFHFDMNFPTIDIIKSFTNLVEANFIKERTVAFYAEQLNLHPNYLNALIKKHTGRTAKESIQVRLLLEIKYMLHSTNMSIKEISSELGFNDPNYFTSFFSRLENISPKNYRSSFV